MTSARPPLLELRGVVKRYGGTTVLDGIDLRIERGETVAILGGSGSGKSTLARIIAGLEAPTRGQVLLEGVDVTAGAASTREDARVRLSMVFQGRALLDGMTVFDNVAFPLREQGRTSEPEIIRRVTAELEALGIADAHAKMPGELSGGMAKRVGIARARVVEPEIVVYDEPTGGLDPVTARIVDRLIDDLRVRDAVTSIIVTHDMATAFGVADRIAVLADGKIALIGSPGEVLRSEDHAARDFLHASGVSPSLVASWRERAKLPSCSAPRPREGVESSDGHGELARRRRSASTLVKMPGILPPSTTTTEPSLRSAMTDATCSTVSQLRRQAPRVTRGDGRRLAGG